MESLDFCHYNVIVPLLYVNLSSIVFYYLTERPSALQAACFLLVFSSCKAFFRIQKPTAWLVKSFFFNRRRSEPLLYVRMPRALALGPLPQSEHSYIYPSAPNSDYIRRRRMLN